jgi:Phospholipase_D-nuclease N-terminal
VRVVIDVGSLLPFLSKSTLTTADIVLAGILLVPLICLWLGAVIDIVLRSDLGFLVKVAWILVVVLLPWLGTLIYLIPRFRPRAHSSEQATVNGPLPRRLSAARSIHARSSVVTRPAGEPPQTRE